MPNGDVITKEDVKEFGSKKPSVTPEVDVAPTVEPVLPKALPREEKLPWLKEVAKILWRDLPVSPYYWKTPEEKQEIATRETLEEWAKAQGIPNPEKYVLDLIQYEPTGEVTMRAYDPTPGQRRLPYIPTTPIGEREGIGEKFVGEWVMPLAIFSGLAKAGTLPSTLKEVATKAGLFRPLTRPERIVERVIGVPREKPIIEKPPVVEMPAIEELVTASYAPNVAVSLGQKLTRAPGIIGSLSRRILPMQAAKTDAERGVIAWMGQRDIAPSLARIEMDVVYAKDLPFKFAQPIYAKGKLPIRPIEEGIVANVKPKSPIYKPHIGAIHEFPDRYIMTSTQRAEIDLLDGILQRQLARELAAGVKVFPVKLKLGQRYFPRFVKELVDLETQAVKEIRRGVSTKPGIRPGSFRERYYEEILDGIVKGKKYTTDIRAAVEMRLAAGNKAISDKMLGDYLAPIGRLPKETIKLELQLGKTEIANKRVALRQISELIEHINAQEPIDWFRWVGIRKSYPEQYASLRAIAKTGKRVTPELKKFIVTEKKRLTETSRDILAKYRKELKIARKPILGKEGMINHAALQGRLFPIDIADPVNALIRGEITPHQVLTQIAKVNAVARMGQTAIDTGFVMIQGLLTLANHPIRWGKAFTQSLKTLVNPKYTARWNAIPEHAATRMRIATHGGSPFGGTEFTEAARAGGWLEKIPVVGKIFQRFGRVFEDYIDTARTLLVEAKLPSYTRKLGRELTSRELTDLVVTVDHMVGIGSMRRLGIDGFTRLLATNMLYAPRYYLAYVGFLGRAFQGGIGGDIARKSLTKFLVAVPAFMSALAYALGQQDRLIPTADKPIPKMFDPRTGEFGSVEIAGTHMGLGGVWIAGFRFLGSLVRTAQDDPSDFMSIDPHENPILRYFYGRASPVASGAIDITTGHNYLGERLDTPDDYLKEVVDKTFPFWLAGQITDVPKAGWQKGLAEWWGLRSWMVQYRELSRRYAEEHIKDIPEEMIMAWQREKELTYDDLNNEQRAWLLNTFADFREAEEKRKEQKVDRGTDFEVADIEVRELLDTVYEADLDEVAKGALAGQVAVSDYQDQTEYLRRIRQGQYQYRAEMQKIIDEERWEDIEKWVEENIKPEDKAYDEYMELRGNPPKIFGKPDWDAWKRNVDTYLAGLDMETRAYIERRRDDWINNLPENAQKLERLILECEVVLDDYYAQAQGRARLDYRQLNPVVDARLFILGRVTKLRSTEASRITGELIGKYGLTLVPSEETQAITPTLITEEDVKAFGRKR